MSEADEIYWINMSVGADEVLASFNWYSASTSKEESTVAVNMAEEIAKLRTVIERIRALHRPTFDGAHCVVCHSSDSSDWDFYPCPTLCAIDGEDA
jgi:hypothetical protein